MLDVANAISKKSYLHDFVGSIVVSKVYKIYRECSLSWSFSKQITKHL